MNGSEAFEGDTTNITSKVETDYKNPKTQLLNHFILHYRSQFVVNVEIQNDSKVVLKDF